MENYINIVINKIYSIEREIYCCNDIVSVEF